MDIIQINDLQKDFPDALAEKSRIENERIVDAVSNIISEVKNNGEIAARKFTEEFDGVEIASENLVRKPTPINDLNYWNNKIKDGSFLESLESAIENIMFFHEKQSPNNFEYELEDGSIFGEKWTPLDRVGCYIPGGSAPLISTVLMTVIPAKIAGVKEIVVATPPQKNGDIHPYIEWVCARLNVGKILSLGGAQSIAALAFGLPEIIEKVDLIVGPGNSYVTEAKRQVFGNVDIDMLAGPSEVCIFADGQSDPEFIAADVLSQLEHDPFAIASVVSTSQDLLLMVRDKVLKLKENLNRRSIIDRAMANFYLFYVNDEDSGKKLIDKIAPEHLELMTSNAKEQLSYPFKAGAIFVGAYTPVAVGDFYGGTNHVLPTGGRASFSSPLSVYDYFRRTSYMGFSREKIINEGNNIEKFATNEELDAHGLSIRVRGK